MTCKRSKQCDHADMCQFAQNTDYNLLGGSCFTPKDPQTNEEFMRSTTTEQLAEWITNKINAKLRMALHDAELYPDDINENEYMENEDEWVEWLKQPHNSPK